MEPFDDTCVAVKAIPTLFGENESPRELLLEALDEWQAGRGQVTRERMRRRVAQMACKHAIKGGDHLNETQVSGFLREILRSDSMPTCPHGRPIVTEITRYALEKRFKRVAVKGADSMGKKPAVIAVAGPTASGKSDLGLALARRLDGEIICMDSMQIYRRMDIGTAKPTAQERAMVPHHMLDVADPTEAYAVVDYAVAAERVIAEIHSRGKVPILVGGTGLYLKALMDGLSLGGAGGDARLRAELNALAGRAGREGAPARPVGRRGPRNRRAAPPQRPPPRDSRP